MIMVVVCGAFERRINPIQIKWNESAEWKSDEIQMRYNFDNYRDNAGCCGTGSVDL